jgi:hypothetical protein
MDRETESALWDLETRLEEYFQALEASIEQRDRFALNASWGIVKAAYVIGAFAVASGLNYWLHWPWWASALVFVAVSFGLLIWAAEYTGKAEERDAKKLWPLPTWQRRYPN